jgi:hypothetical protein
LADVLQTFFEQCNFVLPRFMARLLSISAIKPGRTQKMSIELLTCILITIGALAYVFYLPGKLYMGPEKTREPWYRLPRC